MAYPGRQARCGPKAGDRGHHPRPLGDGGFGYDPVFAPDGFGGRTFAQMTPEEKHAISHRGRAFRALAELLTAISRDPRERAGRRLASRPEDQGGPVVSDVSQGPGWWLASDGQVVRLVPGTDEVPTSVADAARESRFIRGDGASGA